MKQSNIRFIEAGFNENFQFKIVNKPSVLFTQYRLNSTLHWHDHFEVEFIYGGEGIHVVNDTRYKIGLGSVYLLTPSDFHTIIKDDNSYCEKISLYNISFDANVVSPELYHVLLQLPAPLNVRFDEAEFKSIIKQLREIDSEFNMNKPHKDEMIRHKFNCLIIRLLRKRLKTEEIVTPEAKTNIAVQQAICCIKYNFKNSEVSTGYLADMLHLTPNYFGGMFKATLGCTCSSYIRKMRLEFAKGLLINSKMSVSEIAYASGFSTVSYFISEFREYEGIAPGQFRKQHSIEEI